MTDRFGSYHGIGDEFEGGHQTVDHGRGEYARGDAHVNRVESYSVLHQFGAVHEQAVPQVAACERRGQLAHIENHSDETRPIRSPRETSMQATGNRLWGSG
jgi:hypothetical protein